MSGLGPSFMKIRTCGSSPRSGSRNAWTRIKNINSASRPSNFWNFFGVIQMISCQARLVTMDKTWLYHYDLETHQQSMEWRHSSSPRPKKFQVQKSTGKVLASIFWDQDAILLIDLSSIGPNYQRRVLLISAGAIEGHFEWKTLWEGRQGSLVLARQCPGALGTCDPEETGLPELPMSWSPTLFSGSGPIRLPPVPWTEKTIERSPFFIQHRGYCCHGDLVG